MQSSFDFSDRQKGFLFHRNVSRNQILIGKILAGVAIYAIVMGLPLLITAIYLGSMGPDYLPVRPLQIVAPALLISLCYFIHPSTIFMMTRPAKWFGTKILPLAIPVAVCYFFCDAHGNRWQSWGMFAVLSILLSILSLGMFFRSFEKLSIVSNSLASVAILVSIIGSYLLSNALTTNVDGVYEVQAIDNGGAVWNFRYRQDYDNLTRKYKREIVSGEQLMANQNASLNGKVPADIVLTHLHMLAPVVTPIKSYGHISRTDGDTTTFWDERGYFLLYERRNTKRLLGTITRDGFSAGQEPKGRRFTSNPFFAEPTLSSASSTEEYPHGLPGFVLIADRDGVYLLDQITGNLQIAVDKQIESAASVLQGDKLSNGFVVQTQDGLEHYRIKTSRSSRGPDQEIVDQISFEKIATYAKLPNAPGAYWAIGIAPNGKLVALANAPMLDRLIQAYSNVQRPSLAYEWLGISSNRTINVMTNELPGRYQLATLSSPDQSHWSIDIVDLRPEYRPISRCAFTISGILGFVPFALAAVMAAAIVLSAGLDYGFSPILQLMSTEEGGQLISGYLITYAITTLVATVWSYILLRKRSTDKKLNLLWLALSIPFGLATPIAIVALYPKLVFEHCSKCDRMRSVNRSRCEHCGAGWESLPSQGVEIIESQRLQSLSDVT